MDIFAMRAHICAQVKAGTMPMPTGHTLTSIRQGMSAGDCRATLAGQPMPARVSQPLTSTDLFKTTIPAPQAQHTMTPTNDTASDLVKALQAVMQATPAPAQQLDTDAVNALIKAAIDSASINVITMVKAADREPVNVGATHHKFVDLLKIATSLQNPNIMLVGPSGSGKTHAAHQLADALGLAYWSVGACILPSDLIGYTDATGVYRSTQFYEAFKHGGVLILDEIDSYSERASLALNEALSNGSAVFGGERVNRHPSLIVIAGANTWGQGATVEFTGRAKMDGAILGRFAVKMPWDIDEAMEGAIAGKPAADIAKAVRAGAKQAGLKIQVTPRHTMAVRDLMAAGYSKADALAMTVYAGLTAAEINRVGV